MTGRKYKIGFDIGGVISKHTGIIGAMMETFRQSESWEVYIVTDMPRNTADDVLKRNNILCEPEKLLCADWTYEEEMCKANIIEKHGLDVLVDDHLAYLVSSKIPLGLLVVPRPELPYNSKEWKK